MFDSLSGRLNQAFSQLRGKGRLSESDVNDALREVRIALLEADVNVSVVKSMLARVKERAVGTDMPSTNEYTRLPCTTLRPCTVSFWANHSLVCSGW